jgi:hypothetical protein
MIDIPEYPFEIYVFPIIDITSVEEIIMLPGIRIESANHRIFFLLIIGIHCIFLKKLRFFPNRQVKKTPHKGDN